MQTVEQLDNWLKFAPVGSRLVYHIGNLQADRVRIGREVDESDTGKDRMHMRALPVPLFDDIAKAAMTAFYQKRVLLFQRRISPGVCEYFAVKVKGRGGRDGKEIQGKAT